MKLNWSWQTGVIAGAGVVAIVIAAAGFLLAVQPQRTKLRSVEDQISAAQAQFSAMHASASRKPQIDAAELFQLSRAMPEADDMPGILLALSQIAARSHAALVGVTPQPRVALANGSSAVPLQVTINGAWPQITTFLRLVRDQVALSGKRLAVAGRVFDVDSVQLTATNNSPLQAQLQMNAFDYGAPTAPTSTPGTQQATSTTATTTTSSGSQQAAGTQGSGG